VVGSGTLSRGQLTRQELGWLLTQEAQGAAERLRMGVQVLKSNVPPPPDPNDAGPPSQLSSTGVGVDATLDALDDAMRMLSSIHKTPSSVRGRRGRIDLASLLWEVAPEARVSIEPGGGTEVNGDEGELRRMILLLVGHGSGSGSAVTVKRDGDYVRVAVVLGPDRSATADTERAWLNRMAIRYGGRHDLEGGMEVLSLPAEHAGEAKERDQLRKELDEARKQGEAYARELAQVFTQSEEAPSPSAFPPPVTEGSALDRVSTLARFSSGVAGEFRGLLAQVGRDVQLIRTQPSHGSARQIAEDTEDPVEGIKRRLRQVQELVAELAMIGEVDANEGTAQLDLVDVFRTAARALAPQIERCGAEVRIVTVPPFSQGLETRVPVRLSPRAGAIIARELLGQAVAATPKGLAVEVTLHAATNTPGEAVGPRLTVDDAGASLPSTARRAFVAMELEPSTFGRPSSIPLFVCSELIAWQGALLELGDAPAGGLRVGVNFPRDPAA
jgi:two-component system OmpR family sensor kinase